MTRRKSIADVALAAGVSVGTVSNVLNNPDRVRPATREKVFRSMRELGYRPAGLTYPARTRASALSEEPNDPERPLLVSVGYISVDLIARIGVMPHRNDRITAERISKTLGGPAANIAVAAAALGAPYELEVELATAIGRDADSLWALECLAERGVRARAVRSPFNDRLSRCIVLVEGNGQRTKINEPFPLDSKDLIANLPTGRTRRRSHIHFEGYHAEAMLPVARALRDNGWTLSTHDTGLADRFRSSEGFGELMSNLDKVFINRRTASRILGQSLPSERLTEAMAAFLADGPKSRCEVVLTLGMDGAAVFPATHPARLIRVPAPTVTVVDGTGAGDCFVGSYLGQWLRDADTSEAAVRACVCASLVMTATGAQGRLTSAAEAQRYGIELSA